MRRTLYAVVLAALSAACTEPAATPAQVKLRQKPRCQHYSPARNVYYGDLHVHTAYSFDARIIETKNDPFDAYRFAKGEALMLSPLDAQGQGTQRAQLERPLDFVGITDHSEYLGEVSVCYDPQAAGYNSETCTSYRQADLSDFVRWGFKLTQDVRVRFADVCGDDELGCRDHEISAWQQIQRAADEVNDWTDACSFTSFVGYEYTAVPGISNLHRNVIFRNEAVPARPITFMDTQAPHELWRLLEDECLNAGTGCDVLAIPHNSNLANGKMFRASYPDAEALGSEQEAAQRRVAMEPLVEIFQHKGDSECLTEFSVDEQCSFEKVRPLLEDHDCGDDVGSGGMTGLGCISRNDFVRGALLSGLAEDARIGVNPFQLGIIASTDTHNAIPGRVEEYNFAGHAGNVEDTPDKRLQSGFFPASPIVNNPGGLAAVWAEENSRDAIFDALKRRETFGTSGPRISLRLFAGWELGADMCGAADFAERGYAQGVPMGGVLGERPAAATAPVLAMLAFRDAGTAAHPGARLERLQVIKGWLDAQGRKHEKVFDVAQSPGAGLDLDTCSATGSGGVDSFCSLWQDPEFEPQQHAFYYVRVLENPTCRWSRLQCNAYDGAGAPEACDAGYAAPVSQQERAWSSPVWYRP